MTDPEVPTTPVAGSATELASPEPPEAFLAQLGRLRALLVATLMAILLLSVGVDWYLLYQVRMVRTELKATYAIIEDYRNNKEPLLNRLITGLQMLAENHPDLNPLLAKYNIKAATNTPTSTPAPAPPPASGKIKGK